RDHPLHGLRIDIAVEAYPPPADQLDLNAGGGAFEDDGSGNRFIGLSWSCWEARPLSLTSTDRNLARSGRGPTPRAVRHRNSRLVVTRYRRATAETEAPGWHVSSTMRRLISSLNCRRPPRGAIRSVGCSLGIGPDIGPELGLSLG